MSTQHHISNERAIFTLWLNWAISVGALALPEFTAIFVPRSWIPIITFGVMFLLILYRNTGVRFQSLSCERIQTVCVRTLCWSAVIMLIIGVIYARHIISLFYPDELLNMRIPYLTILVLGPVATFFCCVALIQGYDSKVCRECIMKFGTASERGFLGKIFYQEGKYQLRALLYLSASLSLFSWIYYVCCYINVNLNNLDHFVFNWVPSIFYGLSVIFFGMRYFSLWGYYYNYIELNPHVRMNGSAVRFLLLYEDNIFLSRKEEFYDTPDGNKFDTPTSVTLAHINSLNRKEADEYLHNLSGLEEDDYTLRFMYKSTDMSGLANVYHYICCLRSKDVIDDTTLQGKWFSLSQLQRLLYNRDLAPALAAEIHRLYTVTMAWKTYDIEGRRLYKIKNYHPAFRLKGICDWEVDFDNPRWLDVARFNEDKPFFRLRSLFRGRRLGYNRDN